MKRHLFRFCCGLLITATCIAFTPSTLVFAPASKKEVAKIKKQIQKEEQEKERKKKLEKAKKNKKKEKEKKKATTAESTTATVKPVSKDKPKSDKKSNPTILVPMTYYLQTDERWRDYLYGGSDPIGNYGCGPTVLAMLITSFTNVDMTPPEASDWAVDAGYWSKRSGSYHDIMVYGPTAFGLTVERFSVYTESAVKTILENNKVLVCLMGPGHFTKSGHFIIINGMNADGTVRILDPFSQERTDKTWKVSTIFDELSTHSSSGGPVWVVSQ